MVFKKNILLITSEFPPLPGGIGNHAYNLSKYLSKNNYSVSVITDHRTTKETELSFDKSLKFRVFRIPLFKIRFFIYIFRIFKILKNIYKNDVVIASGKFSVWIVGVYSFFSAKKLISIAHGSEINLKNIFLKKFTIFCFKQMSEIIAVSNFTKKELQKSNIHNITVINNGFERTEKLNFSKDKFSTFPNLITIGSVTKRKGQENVIKALPFLIKKYPNIHYRIVGTPYQKKEFLKLAKELSVDKYLTFYGVVSEEKKITLLVNSDIFVMLSQRTNSGDIEGFGIALLEANDLGIPTIGSENCGIEDAINNSKSGFLIDYNNKEQFLNSIEKIVVNYDFF